MTQTWWITSQYAVVKHMAEDRDAVGWLRGGYAPTLCGLSLGDRARMVPASNPLDVCAKCADVVLERGL